MHIVLVEDDEVIRETTQLALERFGYTVTTFADGRDGYEYVSEHGADAVLLDLMLPTMNGASITRAIREKSPVPIIVISARSEPIDIVQALEAGADDYLTKPFDMQVLNARIRTVVRRFVTAGNGRMGFGAVPVGQDPSGAAAASGGGRAGRGSGRESGSGSNGPDTDEQPIIDPNAGWENSSWGGDRNDTAPIFGADGIPEVLGPTPGLRNPTSASAAQETPRTTKLGSLELDNSRLTVTVDGEEVHLTPTELRILLLLTEDPSHVYSREKIAMTVWGCEWAGDSRVVDVHIQRLRKKIGARMIETVRGFGYRFAG